MKSQLSTEVLPLHLNCLYRRFVMIPGEQRSTGEAEDLVVHWHPKIWSRVTDAKQNSRQYEIDRTDVLRLDVTTHNIHYFV